MIKNTAKKTEWSKMSNITMKTSEKWKLREYEMKKMNFDWKFGII